MSATITVRIAFCLIAVIWASCFIFSMVFLSLVKFWVGDAPILRRLERHPYFLFFSMALITADNKNYQWLSIA